MGGADFLVYRFVFRLESLCFLLPLESWFLFSIPAHFSLSFNYHDHFPFLFFDILVIFLIFWFIRLSFCSFVLSLVPR